MDERQRGLVIARAGTLLPAALPTQALQTIAFEIPFSAAGLMVLRGCWSLIFGVVAVFSMSAQEPLHARGEDARRVAMDVVVTDRSGVPVTEVPPEDFEVFDNDTRVRGVQVVRTGAAQVLLLLDAINTSYGSFERAKNQVEMLMKANGGRLQQPVSILILSDQGPDSSDAHTVVALHRKQAFVRRIPPSQDGLTLVKELEQSVTALSRIPEAQGGEGQVERVRLSLQALEFIATATEQDAGASGRHTVLVWISPGWPLLARSNAGTKEQMFDSVVYFTELLRRARITLDYVNAEGVSGEIVQSIGDVRAINPGRFGPSASTASGPAPQQYEAYFKGVRSPKDADANDLALQVLAHQSGGLVLDHNNAIGAQVARCVAEAASGYAFNYEPQGAGYHEVAIRVKRPGSIARTRIWLYVR